MASLISKNDGKSIVGKITSNVGTLLLVVAAFLIGMLLTENRYLKTTGTVAAVPVAPAAQAGQPAAPSISQDKIKELFTTGNNLVFGDPKKKALFVEFSDPSCPYCHVAAGKNSELNKQMGDRFKLTADGGTYVAPVEEIKKLVDAGKAAFVWIYSPGHGNGELGTKALYCANEKGKFWETHDLLMTNAGYNLLNNDVKNEKSNAGKLADFLKPAIDPSFLKSCLDSGKYDARIASDTALATAYGAQGTPGFYVNTTNFAGAYSWADMKSAVDAALN